jgi:hypothetical protein
LAASSARFRGGAFVSSVRSSRLEIAAMSSTAAPKATSLAFEGLFERTLRVFDLAAPERDFALTMLLLSLPFIWTGVVLTMHRLYAVGLPRGLVVFFFVPLVTQAPIASSCQIRKVTA